MQITQGQRMPLANIGIWGATEQKVHLSPTSVVQYLLPRHPVIFRSRLHY